MFFQTIAELYFTLPLVSPKCYDGTDRTHMKNFEKIQYIRIYIFVIIIMEHDLIFQLNIVLDICKAKRPIFVQHQFYSHAQYFQNPCAHHWGFLNA